MRVYCAHPLLLHDPTWIDCCQSAVVPFRDLAHIDVLYDVHGDDKLSANAIDAPQIGQNRIVVEKKGKPKGVWRRSQKDREVDKARNSVKAFIELSRIKIHAQPRLSSMLGLHSQSLVLSYKRTRARQSMLSSTHSRSASSMERMRLTFWQQ